MENYQNFTMKSMKDMKGGEEEMLSSPRLTFMLFMSFVVEKPLLLIKTHAHLLTLVHEHADAEPLILNSEMRTTDCRMEWDT